MITLDDGSIARGRRGAGRVRPPPGTDGIGLETVGLPRTRPLVVVDDLRVPGHDWLYAVGDVNGRALLTHMGKYQARLAADAILGARGRAPLGRRAARRA